jgi:hypothetical protein
MLQLCTALWPITIHCLELRCRMLSYRTMGLTSICLQVGEIGSGQSVTNRSNTIKVTREKGFVVYLADSETEMVEWMSALEGAVARLMRIIAGVDDEQPVQQAQQPGSASSRNAMLAQAESAFKQRAQQPWQEPEPRRNNYGMQGAAGVACSTWQGIRACLNATHVSAGLLSQYGRPS